MAIVALVPLAAWVVAERRSRNARAVLGLAAPSRRARAGVPVAVALTVLLLALAATQPVLASDERTSVRRSADVFVVIDTSRSMLAAAAPGDPTRFDRARAIARRLADSDPSLAVGLASITNRVLPHLFPTTERADFDKTLAQAIGIDRPPPARLETQPATNVASNLAVLGDLGRAGFYTPGNARRIAVVITDGESRPLDPADLRRALARAHVALVFVHVGSARERVWAAGSPAPDYVPDPASGVRLAGLAADAGGQAFSEDQVGEAVDAVRAEAGDASVETRRETTSVRRVAPLVAVAALLPLAFVLWRRNLA